MAAYKHLFGILAIALIAEMALAADYTVGAPAGSWDLTTNYTTWVANQKFFVNDNLIFKYAANFHNVMEVTKSNYESCGLSSPINMHTGGDNTIKLSSAGTRYFLCGIGDHCTRGMKVQINTVAASPPTTPATPSAPTSPPPQSGPSTPTMMMPPPVPSMMPPPPPTSTPSGGNILQVTAASGVGLGFGLVMLLAF